MTKCYEIENVCKFEGYADGCPVVAHQTVKGSRLTVPTIGERWRSQQADPHKRHEKHACAPKPLQRSLVTNRIHQKNQLVYRYFLKRNAVLLLKKLHSTTISTTAKSEFTRIQRGYQIDNWRTVRKAPMAASLRKRSPRNTLVRAG